MTTLDEINSEYSKVFPLWLIKMIAVHWTIVWMPLLYLMTHLKCTKDYNQSVTWYRRRRPKKQCPIEMMPMTPTSEPQINTRIQKVLDGKTYSPGPMKNIFWEHMTINQQASCNVWTPHIIHIKMQNKRMTQEMLWTFTAHTMKQKELEHYSKCKRLSAKKTYIHSGVTPHEPNWMTLKITTSAGESHLRKHINTLMVLWTLAPSNTDICGTVYNYIKYMRRSLKLKKTNLQTSNYNQ